MKKTLIMAAAICIASCFLVPIPVYAREEYITISVDAVDENGGLKYALDSDDPAAFGDSNEFVVTAGTSHTIYVKDAAGNITSQVYGSETQSDAQYIPVESDDEQRINIDLEIGSSRSDTPAEPGSATVASKTITDGSDSAEKVFYTFTTKEGEVLYLIIDQGQGANNVYLLDTVSLADLQVLANGELSSYGDNSNSGEKEDNLLSALTASANEKEEEAVPDSSSSPKTGSRKNAFIILIFAAVGGGVYYYLKVYRNKKDESMDAMDAMDLEDFEPEEEEEEVEFDLDDAEKEEYLERLISEDEDLYDADPDEYATSHMDMDESEVDIDPDMDDGPADDEIDF